MIPEAKADMGVISRVKQLFNKKDEHMEETNDTLIFSATPDTATAEIKGSHMNPQQAAMMAMKQGHPEGNTPRTLDGTQPIPQSVPMQTPMPRIQPNMVGMPMQPRAVQAPYQQQYVQQPQFAPPAYGPGYPHPQFYPPQYPPQQYQPQYQPPQAPAQQAIPVQGEYMQESTTGAEIILMPDEYQVYIDLPGVSRENIQIDFVNNQIVISGERVSMCTEVDQRKLPKKKRPVKCVSTVDRHLLGKFKFTFPLEKFVDSQKITANMENGVLHLTLGLVESIGGVKVSLT